MSQPATRTTSRSTALLLLVGAVLLVIGNATHPVDSNPSATSRLELAASSAWIWIHLVITLGVLAVVAGIGALGRRFTRPLAQSLARLAALTSLVGGVALMFVFGALDGYAASALASEWANADAAARTTIEAAALALDAADSGLTAIGIIALFGLGLGSLGAAVLTEPVFPGWLGWTAAALGAAGLITGFAWAAVGPTDVTVNLLFRPLALLATLFFLLLARVLWREEKTLAAPAPASA